MGSVNSAEFSGKPPPAHEISPSEIRLQLLLARAHFSPEEINGKFSENAKKALRAYAEALQLAAIDKLTQEAWQRLTTDAMAAKQLDRLADKSAPAEEQATRKRRLLKGPEQFRGVRVDRPKARGNERT